jgi:hypothetical protein
LPGSRDETTDGILFCWQQELSLDILDKLLAFVRHVLIVANELTLEDMNMKMSVAEIIWLVQAAA